MKLPLLHLLILLTCAFSNAHADAEPLVESQTKFAFSLFPALESPTPNRVFSPYSIATCLSQVWIGARGNTEIEMQKALFLDINRKSLPKKSAELAQALQPKKNSENSYRLHCANALWVDQGTFLLADFRYAIEQQFQSKIALLDFTDPTAALSTINTWISEETQGKIAQMLTAQDINSLSRLVLTNAIYFQGNWKNPFDSTYTTPASFFSTPDASSQTLMLAQTNLFPYFENDLMQAIALPFIGSTVNNGTLAYLMFLPKSADNFNAMLQTLPDSFSDWLNSLSMRRISLKMPKFTLSNRYDLQNALQKLGIEEAFTSDANFIGIDGMRNLALNKVIHQTYFALDEKGISAAAATSVSLNIKSLPPQEPPIAFVADHPFLFFIVDLKSQEVLFLGKFEQPGTL